MKYSGKKRIAIALTGLLVALVAPAYGQVPCVTHEGYDLFATLRETTFMDHRFKGVNLEEHDFTDGNTHHTGNADTIIHRCEDAEVPSCATPATADYIPIEIWALQLESIGLINVNNQGLDTYFIVLQDVHPPCVLPVPADGVLQPNLGRMQITFDDQSKGTFNSEIKVAFEVRKGSPDGPVALSGMKVLKSTGIEWDRTSDGALTHAGINHNLNGTDTKADFWPVTRSRSNQKPRIRAVPAASATAASGNAESFPA